jgi:TolA-binding protein
LVISFFVAGCAAKAIKNESKCQKITADNAKSAFGFSPSDTDIFMGALNSLADPAKGNDYQTAREHLEIILQKYPKSKWKNSAQALIHIIQNMAELKVNIAAEKQKSASDKSKLNKEIEELKTDIQRLKNLEIQLEKREKSLK